MRQNLRFVTTALICDPMDDFIYFFYEYGYYFFIGLAILKVILILLYKGFDIGYLFENFLMVYADHGIEPNLRRKRFRRIHNVLTVVFYFVLIIWLSIMGVVKFAR
jgi:hypothetical protein